MARGKKNINPKQTADVEQASAVSLDASGLEASTKTNLSTKEEQLRTNSPVIEKTKQEEKDTAPSIIVSWLDSAGRRITRIYACSELKINEYTSETLTKSGKKTIVNVNLEASVIDRDTR